MSGARDDVPPSSGDGAGRGDDGADGGGDGGGVGGGPWWPPDPEDTDFGPDDDTPPVWFAGQHLPADASRMGLTHHVPDGALLDFAGRLDGTKPLHRVTAWVLLGVFAFPVLMYLLRLIEVVLPG